MGVKLSITCRRHAQRAGLVNSRKEAHPRPHTAPSVRDETINRVTYKFSPGAQGTLYPVKLFGIISLFERCRDLSTAACLLYEECGDRVGLIFLKKTRD
jgi:hypothetical protein